MDRTRWWVRLVVGILSFLRSMISPAYDLTFGWIDRRLAQKRQQRLASEIKTALRFLFTEGSIIPNEGLPFPTGFDYAFVTIAFRNLLLRFTRGREALGVHVAPKFATSDWHDLSLVLSAIAERDKIQRQTFRDLWEVRRVLEPQMGALNECFSIDRFNELKQTLDEKVYEPERTAMRRWETEINSALYP
jgi:hypothetical protein